MFTTKSLHVPSKGRVFARLVLMTAAFVVFCVCQSARGDIIFGTGNSPANTNVGAYTQIDDFNATGAFLGGGGDVLEALTDVPLEVPSAGAARIQAADVLFTQVDYTPIGLNWEIFELNPQNDSATGTFVLKVIDNNGDETISGDFALGNGNNRVWAQAINGQSIVQVTVLASDALIEDIRQVRITQSAAAIPEPSTWALCGAAAFGLILLRRRKRTIA